MRFFFKTLLPILFVAISAIGYYAYTEFTHFKASATAVEIESFHIKSGSSIRSVAKSLEEKNIISSAMLFKLLAKISKQESKIKAGEYRLKQGMSPEDLLNHFVKGVTVQYQTRIAEGSSFKDIIALIKADKNLKQTLTDDDYKNIMSKLKTEYKQHKPEGWFFPDTYRYPRATTDLQFLQRAHNAMKTLLQEQWENRTKFKGINTPYDALILASIVEKETGTADDRGKVARVFINRLKINMLLQTDPTVIYGMGESYKGNIRKKDLRKDTPFNTYTRKGLTPTPISTPSAASIKSVFAPADNDKILYFVAKGDGSSYFSTSYKEHKRAVIKYLLKGKAGRYQGDK